MEGESIWIFFQWQWEALKGLSVRDRIQSDLGGRLLMGSQEVTKTCTDRSLKILTFLLNVTILCTIYVKYIGLYYCSTISIAQNELHCNSMFLQISPVNHVLICVCVYVYAFYNVQTLLTSTMISMQNVPYPQALCCQLLGTTAFPSPNPKHWKPLIFFHVYDYSIPSSLCKWNHTIHSLLKPAFLTQQNSVEVHPTGFAQWFPPLYCQVVLHVLPFVHSKGGLGWFQVLLTSNNTNSHVVLIT